MELSKTLIIATSFVAISFLLVPGTASNQVINVQIKTLEQVHDPAKFALTSLPRKLKLNEYQVKSSADKDNLTPMTKKLIKPSSVTKQQEKEENGIHAAGKGTSWINEEGPNKSSEYFTMDYVWIKKRHPIHNKQIPFVP